MLTPQIQCSNLREKLHLSALLYFKRDDLHPFGSHKGRSLPLMIEHWVKEGQNDFVISSSGNAALAAAKAINEYNREYPEKKLKLTIYLGKKINPEKLEKIKTESNSEVIIKQIAAPKQAAFLAQKSKNKKLLRQSIDDSALLGYQSLAEELAQIPELAAVFIPTSSGTTAQGLHRAFKKLGINPQIHIVQTPNCHPFVKTDNQNQSMKEEGGETSLASAIVDKVGHRAKQISQILAESGGKGWLATNNEIAQAMNMVKETENINLSPNSALAVVGLKKAVQSGQQFNGPVVCLITGR